MKRKKAKREKQEFEERVQRNRMICFHETEMYGWTFANDDGTVPGMEKARAYVEHWEDVRKKKIGLILWGEVGTGKTFIAASSGKCIT